jgi:disulfide bond formation protein DsbB
MTWVRSYALYLAWTIALAGVAISLYFGEVLQVEPCRLCWYQRIALFPLALFLGIATYKNDAKLAIYATPFVILGGLFALYQTALLYFPALEIDALCGSSHCAPVFSFFGFLTFPLLSLIGFGAIGLFLHLNRQQS